MKAKKLLLSSIIATQVLTASALAAPDEAIKEFNKVAPIKQEVKHFQGEVKLFIIKDGEKVRVDQKMTDGLRVVNGRTCVGVRDLVNAIEGAKVEWDGTNHIVDITYDGKTISYPVGKPLMWADGKAVTIDVPAQIDPAISKTFLPIRNIAETLGFKVDWDNKAKEVVLTPGAGKGVTTAAQQPRPTTQTPTQNNKTKITLASGKTVDINKKPTARPEVELAGGAMLYQDNYNVSASDFIDNGDTLIFGKGTVFESEIPKRFRRVESSPANSNFRILGENKNDSRVGTYIIGEGEKTWEECRNDQIERSRTSYTIKQSNSSDIEIAKQSPYFFQYIGEEENKEKFWELLKCREIKEKYVKEFYKNKKLIKNIETSRDPFDSPFIDPFYDGTGLFDTNFYKVVPGSAYVDSILASTPTCFVTTDGKIFEMAISKSKEVNEVIVDKVIYSIQIGTKNINIVIDVPNFKIKQLKTKNGFDLSNKALTITERVQYKE